MEIPPILSASTTTPLPTFLVGIAIVRADKTAGRRVMGPANKAIKRTGGGDARGARSRSRGEEPRGGIQRERSTSRKTRGLKMCAELQAEIVAAAAALADDKRARVKDSALADFEAALKEREKAFGRDAISYFVFTGQVEYYGGACPDISEGKDEGDGDSGAENSVGCAATIGGLTRAGEFVDSSDEDRNDEEGSSLGTFINDGDADGTDKTRSDKDGSSVAFAAGRSR